MKKTRARRARREKSAAGATPEQIKREKEKARQLRESNWWKNKLDAGLCHYCGGRFDKDQLTLDHIVPLARGGKSTRGNVVPACKECNNKKKYYTPAELILRDKLKKDVTFAK